MLLVRPGPERQVMRLRAVALASILTLSLTACQVVESPSTSTGGGTHSGKDGSGEPPQRHVRDSVDRGPRPERGRRGSDGWRMDRPSTNGRIEAYTTRASGDPGTPLVLKVSTVDRSFRVAAYRIGAYRGGTSRLVWRSREVKGDKT